MQHQTFQVVTDPVADALDDMAALGLHWTRNRERGRMPSGIRQAMILVAREVLAHVEAHDHITNQSWAILHATLPKSEGDDS